MSLQKLSEHLTGVSTGTKKKMPPVEQWDPPYCGEIDLHVKANGDWFYNGGIFKRLSLVKLFASVLLLEKKAGKKTEGKSEEKTEVIVDKKYQATERENGDYYLVTPVEKVKITVDDAPFVLTQWNWQDDTHTNMVVSTNLEDEFILSAEHPMTISEEGNLYIVVRRNLVAKVHRNVYYQWIDLANEHVTELGTEMAFFSAGHKFSLGLVD